MLQVDVDVKGKQVILDRKIISVEDIMDELRFKTQWNSIELRKDQIGNPLGFIEYSNKLYQIFDDKTKKRCNVVFIRYDFEKSMLHSYEWNNCANKKESYLHDYFESPWTFLIQRIMNIGLRSIAHVHAGYFHDNPALDLDGDTDTIYNCNPITFDLDKSDEQIYYVCFDKTLYDIRNSSQIEFRYTPGKKKRNVKGFFNKVVLHELGHIFCGHFINPKDNKTQDFEANKWVFDNFGFNNFKGETALSTRILYEHRMSFKEKYKSQITNKLIWFYFYDQIRSEIKTCLFNLQLLKVK